MLRTTPESLAERLPAADRERSGVITADAWIDNRDELIGALGLDARASAEISDSALILSAYARWGDRCAERLSGDFAFAIWDERRRTLFCARDHFGVKPFYYHRSPRLFAFASEIKAILCLPDVPRRLNEIRRLLAVWLQSLVDGTRNCFSEISMHNAIGDTLWNTSKQCGRCCSLTRHATSWWAQENHTR